MQKALQHDIVSVEDYLEGEESSEVKHEFISGAVYAMAGVSIEHNLIALNIVTSLRSHLKGKPGKVVMSELVSCLCKPPQQGPAARIHGSGFALILDL